MFTYFPPENGHGFRGRVDDSVELINSLQSRKCGDHHFRSRGLGIAADL